MIGFLSQLPKCEAGVHIYDFTESFTQGRGRGKRIKLTYQGEKGKSKQKGEISRIMVDGEPFQFENTLVIECLPEGIEYLFDYE